MYMTDMLLQMACAAASYELPTLSAGNSQSGAGSGGTSFQDLLKQQQSQATQDAAKDTTQTTQKPEDSGQTGKPVEQPDGQPQEETPSLDLMALGAAMTMEAVVQIQNPVQPVATQEQPVGEVVLPEGAVVSQGVPAAGPTAGQMAQMPVDTVPQEGQHQNQPQVIQPEAQGMQTTQIPGEPEGAPVHQSVQTAETARAEQPAAVPEEGQVEIQPARKQESGEPAAMNTGEAPVFRNTEHMPVKVGESVTVDTTAPAQEVEANLGKALTQAVEEGNQHLQIKLNPANLGNVTVEFTRSADGALHVVLHAETTQAAKLLSEHADTLSMMLREVNPGQVRVEVSQPQQSQQDPQFWQQDQQGSHQQQQQQHRQQQSDQDADSFLHQLRLGLLDVESQG